jgi:GntR family transcriptional regulator
MFLNLTDLSDEPLQSQIVRQIRVLILAGELTAGQDLPSIRGLAREQHISVITVQRAYETLERGGLIHSRRGKGFFVSELSADSKSEMSEERLLQVLEPALKIAVAEGLAPEKIRSMVEEILKNQINSFKEEK